MLKIGLTGGIASGKTSVSRLFEQLGAPVIDADEISRRLVEPGQPALYAIAESFGDDLLDNGNLNRERLRKLIFANPLAKSQLENLLHPLIYAAMDAETKKIQTPYCILAIPLLIETRRQDFVDHILLVDCPVEIQKQRLALRAGMEKALIEKIIASQASRALRRSYADTIIDNSGDFNALQSRVEQLDRYYKDISLDKFLPKELYFEPHHTTKLKVSISAQMKFLWKSGL